MFTTSVREEGLPLLLPVTLLSCAALTVGCSSSSGSDDESGPDTGARQLFFAQGESEPNDSSASAALLERTSFGTGDVATPGDADYWSFSMAEGEVVQIEVAAARMNRVDWTLATNVPRLTIWDTDGTTKILEHDYSGNFGDGWGWGLHDLDIPMFAAPSAGTYYASVTRDNTTNAGADYGIRITPLTIAGKQFEAEAAGVVGVNDSFGTAEPITPGTMFGFLQGEVLAAEGGAADRDYYALTLTEPASVYFELTGYRNGFYRGDDELLEVALGLFDTDGTTLLAGVNYGWFNDPSITYTFRSAGTYYLRLRHSDGSASAPYSLKVVTRSTATQGAEAEPNNDAMGANTVAFGTQVEGSIPSADVDYWKFNGRAGDIVYAHFYESSYFSTVSGGPANGFVLPNSQFIGPDGSTATQGTRALLPHRTAQTLLTQDGEQYLAIGDIATSLQRRGGAEHNYKFRLFRTPAARMESEPNDLVADAAALNSNNRGAGVISTDGDVDIWSFTAEENEAVTVVVFANPTDNESWGNYGLTGIGSDLRAVLAVEDSEGIEITTNDVSSLPTFLQGVTPSAESVVDPIPSQQIVFIAPAAGTYYVKVTDEDNDGGPEHKYLLLRK